MSVLVPTQAIAQPENTQADSSSETNLAAPVHAGTDNGFI